MNKIYLDQASTSFPKAPSVAQAVYDYLAGSAVNVNRGGYRAAYSVEEQIFETREQLLKLFHFTSGKGKNVIFTENITASLNVLLKGLLKPGDHVPGIPLKVNTAGVIPVIFASSIMSFPAVIAQLTGKGNGTGIGSEIIRGLSSNNWCNPKQLQYTWGLVLYIVLCVFFAYFYTSITFNPLEVADNIKKQGGFIPGIRPGKPTSDYLTNILNYIIFIGAVGLIIVCVIPFIFNGVFGANVSFGGTSIIIIVGVILETVKQIESQLLVRNYKGFLNN